MPRLTPSVKKLLACPMCGNDLAIAGKTATCAHNGAHAFPIVDGIPILINEDKSVFSIADFVKGDETFFRPSRNGMFKRIGQALMPSANANITAERNFARFAKELLAQSRSPRILIVGGSIAGEGTAALFRHEEIEFVETDVAWGPRLQLICDIHDLPFKDASFDGVVVQAVLEHVVDPYRGVEELHRVLKPSGLVYAETPFMQQVHGGRYDFTRFSFLGHRRLFRRFEEVESGVCCGPGMALAWSWRYFLWSFTSNSALRRVLLFIANWTSFFWKYFDRALVNRPSARDAASGYYFLGRRSERTLPDRELLALYDR